MEVRWSWRGIVVIVVKIEAVGEIHVRREVRVPDLQAVIHNADPYPSAFEVVPNARHIHIRACGGTVLAGVLQMPLVARIRGVVGEIRVIGHKAVEQLMREHGFRREHARCLEQAGCTC